MAANKFRYKIDVLKKLKECGYSSYMIRCCNLIGQGLLTDIRHGKVVGIDTLSTICELTGLDIGDIIEFKRD